MKNVKRNILLTLCSAALLAAGIPLFASCKGSEADFELKSNKIWLNRYEEKSVETLEFVKGSADGISYSVANEAVVTVENGRFIAQGEGETTVELKNKSGSRKVTVLVRDDGTMPILALENEETACAYTGVEKPLPVRVEYGDEVYEIGENFTLSVSGAAAEYLSVNGNKITGLKTTEAGKTAKVTASCTYKGLELESSFRLSVRESSFIEFAQGEIDLYYGNTTLKSYVLQPKEAVYKAEKIEAKNLFAEAIEDADKVEISKNESTGLWVVTAKAGSGTAKIRVSYAGTDGGMQTDLQVNLHPNYIETEFTLANAAKGATYENAEGVTGLLQDRADVKKYVADPEKQAALQKELSEGKKLNRQKLQLSDTKNANDPLRRSFEDRRLELPDKAKTVAELYRAGYRYFSFDLYIKTQANEGDMASMPLCLYGSEREQSFNELFSRDGVYVLQGDKIVNRLETNVWQSVVFELYTLAYVNPDTKAAFYFALNDGLANAYLDDVRFYLDDEFLPKNAAGEHRPAYETEIEYGAPDENGVIAVKKGSEFVPYFSNNLSVEKAGEEITKRCEEANDRHENAYLFTSLTGGAWNSSAILVSSMSESYYDGVTRLRRMGNYLVFDMYVISAERIQFRLNHFSPSATFTAKSDLTTSEYYWIDILDKSTGKACKTFERGVWQTVVLHYNEAVYANGWSSFLAVGVDNQGGKILVDNVKFLKNYETPRDIKQPGAREAFTSLAVGGASGWSDYTVNEAGEPQLKFSHNVKLQDNVNGWSKAGVKFAMKENIGENNYLKLSFKFDPLANAALKQTIFIFNGGAADETKRNIWAHEWGDKGVAAYDENGSQLAYAQLVAGKWYEMYISITDRKTSGGDVYLAFVQNDYDAATEHPEIVGYIKNVSFEASDPIGEALAPLQKKTRVGSRVSAVYGLDDGEAAVTLSTSAHFQHSGVWQNAGLQFNVKDYIGENNYLKLSFKIEGEAGDKSTGVFFRDSKDLIWMSDQWWYEWGHAHCVDESGKPVLTGDIEAGKWYTIYYKIPEDCKTNATDAYYLAFYDKNFDANAATHKTVTATVKNVDYVAKKPAGSTDAILDEKTDWSGKLN